MSPKAAEEIEEIDYNYEMVGVSLLITLPFVSMGSLLPAWMFINSLQLLAHLPLLN